MTVHCRSNKIDRLQVVSFLGGARVDRERCVLKRFTEWARTLDLPICVTNNRRSVVGAVAHDSWGGRDRSAITAEAAIAAVNGHLVSLGGH